MNDRNLYLLAKKAKDMSYSPYSKFKVGAALLCKNGDVYLGTNIENASFGATVCAERVAIYKAVSDSNRDFCKIAVAGDKDPCTPCGICRQVMAEFSANIEIVYKSKEGEIVSRKISDLLPENFSL